MWSVRVRGGWGTSPALVSKPKVVKHFREVGFWVETLLYVVNSCPQKMGNFPYPCVQARSGGTHQGRLFFEWRHYCM